MCDYMVSYQAISDENMRRLKYRSRPYYLMLTSGNSQPAFQDTTQRYGTYSGSSATLARSTTIGAARYSPSVPNNLNNLLPILVSLGVRSHGRFRVLAHILHFVRRKASGQIPLNLASNGDRNALSTFIKDFNARRPWFLSHYVDTRPKDRHPIY